MNRSEEKPSHYHAVLAVSLIVGFVLWCALVYVLSGWVSEAIVKWG